MIKNNLNMSLDIISKNSPNYYLSNFLIHLSLVKKNTLIFCFYCLLTLCGRNITFIEEFEYQAGQKFTYEVNFSILQENSITYSESNTYILEVVSIDSKLDGFTNLIELDAYNTKYPTSVNLVDFEL